jgi:hypothetical protein
MKWGREKNEVYEIECGQMRKPGKENLHRAFSSLV